MTQPNVTDTAPSPDVELIGQFWDTHTVEGETYEVRIPKPRKSGPKRLYKTTSGYFNARSAFVSEVRKLTGQDAPGVYITLNPVDPDLLPRAANRLVEGAESTTSDHDVVALRRFLIDVDPVRPTGICASDPERELGLDVRESIQRFLADELDWPDPTAVIDSGSGGHLHYAIDLPNDPENVELIRRCLGALAALFSTESVSIDQTVYNPARITRIPGTVNAKGDSIAARPWRLCIGAFDDGAGCVDSAKLNELAARWQPQPSPSDKNRPVDTCRTWGIADVLSDSGIGYEERSKPYAKVYDLDRCLTSTDHSDGACILEFPNGALAYRCHHNRCVRATWADAKKSLRFPVDRTPRLSLHSSPDQKPADDADDDDEITRTFRTNQATSIVELLGSKDIELFHNGRASGYASVVVNGHTETWSIESDAFRDYTLRLAYELLRTLPSAQTIQTVLSSLSGKARFEGECRSVQVRIARTVDAIFLDLGDPEWRLVRVDAMGWEVIQAADAPVRFERPVGLLPLPVPERGGSICELNPFLNIATPTGITLLVGWLLGVFYDEGCRTILCLYGEQGSAKSTTAKMLRSLVDPNDVPLRAQPRDELDLIIAAKNGAVAVFDNLSKLSDQMSDALCRLATGAGQSRRKLYTDVDESLIGAKRPVLLTSITEIAINGDVLDRSIVLTLPSVNRERRRSEREYWASFERARPRILGALLDGVSSGLAHLDQIKLPSNHRVADLVNWVEAAGKGLGWPTNAFFDALDANRRDTDQIAIESRPVGVAILQLVERVKFWEGTATQLQKALEAYVDSDARKDPDWPKAANKLSHEVRKLSPNLRRLGIEVYSRRVGKSGQRVLHITATDSFVDRQ